MQEDLQEAAEGIASIERLSRKIKGALRATQDKCDRLEERCASPAKEDL